MGGQIAYQAALHGYDVRLISRSDDRLRSASTSCAALLRRRVEKGKLDGDACESALARVTLGSDFAAVAGAGTIIEFGRRGSRCQARGVRADLRARG